MPNNHETLTSLFEDIADAIREKTGSEESIVADEFPEAIAAIPTGGGEDLIQHAQIPDYVKTEALALAEKVKERQTADSITFIVGTDAHQWGPDDGDCDTAAEETQAENILTGNLHAGMAMKSIAYALPLDFTAYLGDYTWGSSSKNGNTGTTINEGLRHISEINADIGEAFKGLPQFRTTGNHDPLTYSYSQNGDYLDQTELKPLIADCNTGAVYGDTTAGYCYRDFNKGTKTVRVICLNTADISTPGSGTSSAEGVSTAQKQWFAALLASTGALGINYSMIILSHHPLDWGNVAEMSNILYAYVSGGSISVDGVTYNYNGANAAQVICAFHGHTHCYKHAKLNRIVSQTGVEYDAYRMAIPNMCFARNNEYGRNTGPEYYDIEFGESATYNKTEGTANDTAFCVITIDFAEKIIYAYHYGAGPASNDKCRILPYDFGVNYHVIKQTTIKCRINGPGYVQDGGTYTATVQADLGYSVKQVIVRSNGADITASAYDSTTGVITVTDVHHDIEVLASVFVNHVWTSTDDNGLLYNGCGYKPDYRFKSSAPAAFDDNIQAEEGAVVSGMIPYDGERIQVGTLDKAAAWSYPGNYVILFDPNMQFIYAVSGANNGTWANKIWTLDPQTAVPAVQTYLSQTHFIRVGLRSCEDSSTFAATLDEDLIN